MAERLKISRSMVGTAMRVGYAVGGRNFPEGKQPIKEILDADRVMTRAEASDVIAEIRKTEDVEDRHAAMMAAIDSSLDDAMESRKDAGVATILARRATTAWLAAGVASAKLSHLLLTQLIKLLEVPGAVTDPKLILEYVDKLSKLQERSLNFAEKTDKLERAFLGEPDEIRKILLQAARQSELSEDESERVIQLVSQVAALGPVPESVDAMKATEDVSPVDVEFDVRESDEDPVEDDEEFDFSMPDEEDE